MKNRLILLLTPLIAVGGEEVSSLVLSKELIRRGYRIIVKGNAGPMHKEFINIGATFVPSSEAYQRTPTGLLKDAKDIRMLIDNADIDIIHSQSVLPTVSAFLACRSLRNARRPRLVFHHRGLHSYSYPIVGRLSKYIVDYVIVNSEYERRKLIRNGLSDANSRTIYNSINITFPQDLGSDKRILKEFGISPDMNVITTVGRLVKEKGLQFLMEAFKEVLRVFPKTYLLIVGDGVLRNNLEQLTFSLGLQDRVVFTGMRRDLDEIYRSIDIFVLSSVFESFGNVALEAASYGKPVIATRVGGLPEAVLDGQTGILVPPANIVELASAMIEMLGNREKAVKMGQAGRERIRECFLPERVANDVEQVYEQVLRKT
jgi:glycosyltransferase involved in cell wall biosynthesis